MSEGLVFSLAISILCASVVLFLTIQDVVVTGSIEIRLKLVMDVAILSHQDKAEFDFGGCIRASLPYGL